MCVCVCVRVVQTIVLAALFVEAIVVLARQRSHLRITRALRPIFFIDNVLMDEVRRYYSRLMLQLPLYTCMTYTYMYYTLTSGNSVIFGSR